MCPPVAPSPQFPEPRSLVPAASTCLTAGSFLWAQATQPPVYKPVRAQLLSAPITLSYLCRTPLVRLDLPWAAVVTRGGRGGEGQPVSAGVCRSPEPLSVLQAASPAMAPSTPQGVRDHWPPPSSDRCLREAGHRQRDYRPGDWPPLPTPQPLCRQRPWPGMWRTVKEQVPLCPALGSGVLTVSAAPGAWWLWSRVTTNSELASRGHRVRGC